MVIDVDPTKGVVDLTLWSTLVESVSSLKKSAGKLRALIKDQTVVTAQVL